LGLNYQDQNGRWIPSQERFVGEAGWAVAREGRHSVALFHNLNAEGSVVLDQSDGQRIRSHLLGLVYHDTASGQSVLIGEVQNSQGLFVRENQVLFENAFAGVSADVRYTYSKSGFSQDVILREELPAPENYQLNGQTTRLEVWTEFLEAPEPVRTSTLLNASVVEQGDGAPLTDEELDFGAMRIGLGRAFSLGQESDNLSFVAKSWNVTPDGRRFLIETVEFSLLDGEGNLPPNSGGARITPEKQTTREAVLAQFKGKSAPTSPGRWSKLDFEVANLKFRRPGLVVDYTTINTSYTNYTFKGNETYYVSGLVTCAGTTTFEGGAVIKYTNTATARIEITGTTVFPSSTLPANSPYRPIIFTAKDDNSVGLTITGSSGTPSGYYADVALKWANATTAIDARNLRFIRATVSGHFYK